MRAGIAISADQSIPGATRSPGGGHRAGQEKGAGFKALPFAARFTHHGVVVAGHHES